MNIDLHDMLADCLGAKGIVGVPPEIALDALRKTAIDFCTQSTIWEFYNGFDIQYNVADYPVEVPEGSRLASMKWVAVNGYMLTANTAGVRPIPIGITSLNPNAYYYYGFGQGYTFTMDGRDWFIISPIPIDTACCDHVRYCAALKPTQNACEIPEFLYQDWNDALTSGTAFRLFGMPKQEWSNSGLAMLNQREYSRWIARARLTKMQNYTQAPGIMTGAYF